MVPESLFSTVGMSGAAVLTTSLLLVSLPLSPAWSVTVATMSSVLPWLSARASALDSVTLQVLSPPLPAKTLLVYVWPLRLTVTVCPASASVVPLMTGCVVTVLGF